MNPNNPTPLQGTTLANFMPAADVPALQVTDLVEGTGEAVQPGATITAHYTGALASDGTIFQSSHDMGQAVTFGLSQVIAGWTQGVPGMKVGGTRRLLIPPPRWPTAPTRLHRTSHQTRIWCLTSS